MAIPSSANTMLFVNTNLETHLALDATGSDTVADLKRKIRIEHHICFPRFGEIEIDALKVERRGCFYNLSDSVLIKNVCNGIALSWYFYADVSTLLEQSGRVHHNPNSSNQQACLNVTNNPLAIVVSDGPGRWLANINGSLSEIEYSPSMSQEVPITERMCSGDSSRESSEVLVTLLRHTSENHCRTASMDTNKDHELPDKLTECMVDISMNGTSGMQGNNILLEKSTPNKPTEEKSKNKKPSKKSKNKKPSKKREDAVHDLVLKENDLLAGRPRKDALQQEVFVHLNSLGNAEKEGAHDARMENVTVVQEPCMNSSSDGKEKLVSGVHKITGLSEGNETLTQLAEGNNGKSENGVLDVQPSNLLGEISKHKSSAKRKRKRSGSGVQETNDMIEEVEVVVNSKNDESEKGIVDVHCSNLLGDAAISMCSSPPKKKCKVKKNNSNKDANKCMTTPEHSLGEKHESKNPTSDGLDAECTEDIHSLRTSSSTGKKKRKSKSTDPHKVVAAVLSPVRELREESTGVVEINHKDSEEPQATGIGGRLLGEAINIVSTVSFGEKHDGPVEVSKRNLLGSLDVDMGDANPEEPDKSGVKGMDTSRSGHVDVNDLPLSTVQDPNGLQVTIDRVDDHKRIGANQTDKTIEARDLYKTDDPKGKTPKPASSCKKTKKSKRTSGGTRVMSSAEIAGGVVTGNFSTEDTSMKDDDSAIKSKSDGIILSQMEVNDSSKLESTDDISPVATDGKTEKRIPGGVVTGNFSTEDTSMKDDDSAIKSKSDGIILSQMEVNDSSKLESTDDISPVATDGKTEKRIPAEVTSSQQISNSQADGESGDGKKKRKTRKPRTHAATDLPEVQEKEREQNVGFRSPAPSSDVKLVDCSSKKSKKRKSSKPKSLNPNLVPVEGTVVASSPLDKELLSGTVHCSQVSSASVRGSDERTLEIDCNVDSLTSGFIEEDISPKEGSCEGNQINFKEYFVHGQNEEEVKSSGEILDNKINKDKVELHSVSVSPDPLSFLKVNEKQGTTEKAQGGNSSTIKLLGSSLKNKSSKPLPQSKTMLLKASGSGKFPVPSDNASKSSLVSDESRKSNVPDASVFVTPMQKKKKVSARTKNPKSISKASGSHMGEVVSGTKLKKSLLATSNAIFKDDSSMDSRDHQVGVNSDATTRTPSDYLSSSDGEGWMSEEDSGKNTRQSHSAVPKNVTLDTILRGSSRFKKAKLTAVLSQPDEPDESEIV